MLFHEVIPFAYPFYSRFRKQRKKTSEESMSVSVRLNDHEPNARNTSATRESADVHEVKSSRAVRHWNTLVPSQYYSKACSLTALAKFSLSVHRRELHEKNAPERGNINSAGGVEVVVCVQSFLIKKNIFVQTTASTPQALPGAECAFVFALAMHYTLNSLFAEDAPHTEPCQRCTQISD